MKVLRASFKYDIHTNVFKLVTDYMCWVGVNGGLYYGCAQVQIEYNHLVDQVAMQRSCEEALIEELARYGFIVE